MKSISYIFSVLATLSGFAQTINSDYNAVRSSHLRVPTTNSSDLFNPATGNVNIEYTDGLGRELQTVGHKQGFLGQNDIIVKATNYDSYGRVDRTYLNFPSTDNGNVAAAPTSIHGDSHPYMQTKTYDGSPLNKVYASYGVGDAWYQNDKTVQNYTEITGGIKGFKITSDGATSFIYAPNTIYKTITINEQGKTTHFYKDKEGKTIVIEQVANNESLKTGYIYNKLGQVIYIIQPAAYDGCNSFAETDALFKNYVFAYKYDAKGQVISTHTPAAGWDNIVYNKLNQAVLKQDALQKEQGYWDFMQYDKVGRVIKKGTYNSTQDRNTLQNSLNNHTTLYEEYTGNGVYGYTSNSFPFSVDDNTTELAFYYDNYDWLQGQLAYVSHPDYANTPLVHCNGKATGFKEKCPITGNYVYSVNYYNNEQQVIQTQYTHALTTTSRPNVSYTKFGFAGQVLQSKMVLSTTTSSNSINQYYTYDPTGRKLTTEQQINSQAKEVIEKLVYDDLGRLKQTIHYPNRKYKSLGSTTSIINRPPNPSNINTVDTASAAINLFNGTEMNAANTAVNTYEAYIVNENAANIVQGLQTIDYDYHIRGAINCINCENNVPILNTNQNDVFTQKLEYETTNNWDGNIGKHTWKSYGLTEDQAYNYAYDEFNRLTTATYQGNNKNYSLQGLQYDKNGNILHLKRYGRTAAQGENYGVIDDLSYNYNANQLNAVSDAINISTGYNDFKDANTTNTDYTYYINGSLKEDKNKGIDNITYNRYGLPSEIHFSNGKWVKQLYDGQGTKVLSYTNTGDTTYYIGTILYKKDSLEGIKLYQLSTDYGRILNYNASFINEFAYRDHQNNLRIAYLDTVTGTINIRNSPLITKTTNYDAWGWEWNEQATGTNLKNNDYTFLNREKMVEVGWQDLKQRTYDPLIGRFGQIDPLTSTQEHLTPYQYGWNNPVFYTDPNGDCPNCVTAAIGGAIGGGKEIASQMIGSMMGGKGFKEAFNSIDWADVGVEAVKGVVIGSGVGVVAAGAVQAGGILIKANVDYSNKSGLKTTANGSKSWTDAGIEMLSEAAGKIKMPKATTASGLINTKKVASKADDIATNSRKGAFSQAKKDAGIPKSQHPNKVNGKQYDMVPMTDRNGKAILGADNKPIMTREYTYSKSDGSKVIIQDHSAGHPQYGGDAAKPHFNVRPPENTRTGTVPATQGHYTF